MSASIRTRIMILSDTHAQRFQPGLEPLEPVDLVIHCGDLTNNSTLRDYREAIHLLDSIKAPLKIVIAGNHDFSLEDKAYRRKIMETCRINQEDLSGAIKAEYGQVGEAQQILLGAVTKGITFLSEGPHQLQLPNNAVLELYVSQYTPTHNCPGWGFQYDGIHDFNIKQGTDIVITHGPPLGIMDLTSNNERIGCPQLFAAVARAQPRVHCFGHVHESWGTKLVSWKPNISNVPHHFTDINNDQSIVIENLARLNGHSHETPREKVMREWRKREYASRRYCHINPTGAQMRPGETMFVNAALMGNGLFDKVPWLIELDLDENQGAEFDQELSEYMLGVGFQGNDRDERKRSVESDPSANEGDIKRRRVTHPITN